MSVVDSLIGQMQRLRVGRREAIEQLERARDIAVALEQENALLTAQRDALAAIVRDAFPAEMTLDQIARTWGNAMTEEQLTALHTFEHPEADE